MITPVEKKVVESLHSAVKKIIREERRRSEEYILQCSNTTAALKKEVFDLQTKMNEMTEILTSKLWNLAKELK